MLPERPLTAAQRAYLDAFDKHLRAELQSEADRARRQITSRLAPVLDEAGVIPSGEQRLYVPRAA